MGTVLCCEKIDFTFTCRAQQMCHTPDYVEVICIPQTYGDIPM